MPLIFHPICLLDWDRPFSIWNDLAIKAYDSLQFMPVKLSHAKWVCEFKPCKMKEIDIIWNIMWYNCLCVFHHNKTQINSLA